MPSGRLPPILFALGLALCGAPTSAAAETLPLPPALTDFTSHAGEAFLIESKAREDYFPLSIQFVTQKTPAYCGVASMVMVLNALNVPAPSSPDNQAFRTFTQDNVLDDSTDAVLPRDLLARQGMTLSTSSGRCLRSTRPRSRSIMPAMAGSRRFAPRPVPRSRAETIS